MTENKKPWKSGDWVHLKDCEQQFERFFNDDSGVFVLKGDFGSGKSYFVRESILHGDAFSKAFRFSSRISLFGVNSLSHLEETAIGSLKYCDSGPDVATFDGGFKAIQKALKPLAGGVDLQLSARSFFWAMASNLGFLLVIDDVDRKGDELPLKEVLGFAASLAEQSEGKTKVLLVVNEDGLSKVEERSDWDSLREKFIDSEFTFSPPPRELAHAYVEGKLADIIGDIFHKFESPNIRAMKKVESYVKNFKRFLSDKYIEFPEHLYEHSAKYAALFLRAGNDYLVSDLPGWSASAGSVGRAQGDKDNEVEDRVIRRDRLNSLMGKIEFSLDIWWDGLLSAFLNDGTVDPLVLEEFKNSLPSRERQSEFHEFEISLELILHGSLRDNGDEFKAAMEDGVSNFAELMSAPKLREYSDLIESLGHAPELIWDIWIEKRKANFSNPTILNLRELVPEKSRDNLPPIAVTVPTDVSPFAYLMRFDDHEFPFDSETDLPALAQWKSEDWVKWITRLTAEQEIALYPILGKLREAAANTFMNGVKGDIAKAVEKAVKELAGKSHLNEWRVKKYFPSLFENEE